MKTLITAAIILIALTLYLGAFVEMVSANCDVIDDHVPFPHNDGDALIIPMPSTSDIDFDTNFSVTDKDPNAVWDFGDVPPEMTLPSIVVGQTTEDPDIMAIDRIDGGFPNIMLMSDGSVEEQLHYPDPNCITWKIIRDELVCTKKRMTILDRIAKLEAELQRVAALVYFIHGGLESSDDGWSYKSTCKISIPRQFGEEIDECLSNVTIHREE